jgi:4-amino-4-deoxy-L-arabinose transferase-like glycosyltransferase
VFNALENKRNQALVVGFACFIFALQAVPLLSFRWVEDESWYSATAYTLLREGNIRNAIFGPNDVESKADTRPLAMPVMLAGTMEILGVGPSRVRLPGLVLSILLIPLVFWLGCILGSWQAGLIAALLMSVDNMLFLASRTVRPEAFVAFFGTLAVLLYFLSRQRESTGLAILCGLSLGIGFNYHVNGLAIAASIGLLLIGEFRWSLWRQKRAWAIVLASVATLIPFVLWLNADPIHMEAFRALYGRGKQFTGADMVYRWELRRYQDYLGFGSTRLSFIPYPIPLRAHIVLLFLASLAVLAWKRRPAFWIFVALIVPSMLMWPNEVNPTVRYLAILAPFLVVATGMAFTVLENPGWRRLFAAWCVLVFLTQGAANGVLLWQSRKANYPSVARQLRSMVPPDARVYGAITFFLALHDRTYYSWNRTSLDDGLNLGINYLILNDRLLLHGSGFGIDEWRYVREPAEAFVQTHADLVGHVPDPFYGDLQIYRVKSNANNP